jgi:CRISPR-associated protein Cas2
MDRRFYLFTYDISDPKRLRKVFKTLVSYGMHRQLSVFICELTEKKKILLLRKLRELIDPAGDQVLFVPLCHHCAKGVSTIGQPMEPLKQDCLII